MKIDWNQNWSFSKIGEAPMTVHLPHDAMLLEKRDPNCHNGVNSGYFPGGKYRYEKTLTLSEADADRCVELLFEGVYRNARVYVNGALAGEHRYGYTEFTVDCTAFVHAGENSVAVTVDNSLEPNCRWYSGSGIYRPVWLRIWDKKHPTVLQVKTVSHDPAIVEITADEGATVVIYDGDTLIASGKPGRYEIPNAKLWSAEHPHLYTAAATLGNETIETTFGIRSLTWSAQDGLCVNGERVLLRGGCIHHDNGILGACGFKDAEERRVRILKEAGYNAIRSAHNPMSRAMLDACDRLGMYVMDEAFDGWYIPKTYHDYARIFDEEWQNDLRAMVEKDVNHPSVILYSVGNEVSETATQKGVETCGKLADFVHLFDPSRSVTCGINVLLNVYANMGMGVYREKGAYKPEPLPESKGYREKKTGSAFFNAMAQRLGKLMFTMSKGKKGDKACKSAAEKLDVLGLNYAASRYDADVRKYPDRMMVGSETMVTDLPYNWKRVKQYPAVIGDFVWAAWDYLGEAGIGDWMYHSYPGLPIAAGSGTVDLCGNIGAEAVYQQVVWSLRKAPYIGVRPLNHVKETPTRSAWRFTDCIDSWTWHGYEGTKAIVEVFANGHTVRLELDGKTLGTKKLKAYKCLFKVPYRPGTLTAIALDEQGNELSRHSISSGTYETVLTASPEKRILKANGQDLCFLPIAFTDPNGVTKPYMEDQITVEANGAVTLAGFGSAAIKTDESYLDNTHRAYRGRALAVLRAGKTPGTATVTVRSERTKPITICIEVQA